MTLYIFYAKGFFTGSVSAIVIPFLQSMEGSVKGDRPRRMGYNSGSNWHQHPQLCPH
ncbi:hypothetical protein PN499_10445 [Kamptonema animale CS-326]|uniref:hypothetical protein n=1 Tax=Kamptonema animale TaxID=92934 RepID=UPI00232C573B|nr:hypothetical protein [Kamptonema animale]MDB9511601.1 hypothetical protein [Kamptonema animale CS-326]